MLSNAASRASVTMYNRGHMPNANRLTVGIMAMVAEEERQAISERTNAALAAAKASGVKLGGRVENLKDAELGRQKAAEARQAKAASRTADLRPAHRGYQGGRGHHRDGDGEGAERARHSHDARRPVAGRAGSKASAGLMTEAGGCCLWCGSRFERRNDGGKAQRFSRPACRRALDPAGRRWILAALASGALSVGDLRNGSLTTRALLPGVEALAAVPGPGRTIGPCSAT
jgi:hypothetical protein